ncbi:protein FAM43A [Procambarus clarkii]|uniref:protein FAM43A n=1 Tax=Procambarus clarkii TaxID=6728 RepID=UPI001E678A80|nr:protein FAM43A-like [Procambarus clarkii]XP_045581003.1 protein FAM43A-like [Procambarus clarkii]
MPNMNLKKLWRKKSVTITEYDPTYKVVYLGNVLTGWAKGEGCVDKPLATLWRNYCQSTRQDIAMKVTICGAGLRAVTREHGLTEYWAHRVTYCVAHPAYPRVFCWVYRHEGRRLKQELRCHAVLCPKNTKAEAMATQLRVRLTSALQEFRREKVVRQNARMSLMHAIYDSASIPRRKLLLSTGAANYRPPLERSKSAPKLGAIEETIEEEDEEGLGNSDEEEIDDLASVHLQPEEDVGGSSTMSETTSDIVVDYDSSSEVASAGQDHYVLEEEYEDDSPQFASPCHHSESLLYCPVPPLSPLDDRPLHHKPLGVVEEAVDDEGSCDSTRGADVRGRDDLGLLASLTRELNLAPPAEESLTSDQPESLGSHSCSSSCGACSDPCDVTTEQENLMNESDHIINESHLINGGENPGKMARMEGDNISEESGYSEDKDSLQNLDATKL